MPTFLHSFTPFFLVCWFSYPATAISQTEARRSEATAPRHAGSGRLFFSPAQRQEIERQHARQEGGNHEIPSSPESYTVNGIAVSSSGRRTVWINGTAREEPPLPVQPSFAGTDSAPLTAGVIASPGAPPARLKAGERLRYDPKRREYRIDSGAGSGTVIVRNSG